MHRYYYICIDLCKQFQTLISLFPLVDLKKIFDSFGHLDEDIVYENCKYLIDNNHCIPPECIFKMLDKRKLRTFQLLMQQNEACCEIEINKIYHDQTIQQALIPYLEDRRIVLKTAYYSHWKDKDLDFFLAAFKPIESEPWYPFFKEKSRYFMKFLNSQNYINSSDKFNKLNPVEFVTEIFNNASKSNISPICYSLKLLVASIHPCYRDKIWKVLSHAQSDQDIKKIVACDDEIKLHNVLDFRSEHFTSLYREVQVLCQKNKEDIEYLAGGVFKLSVLFPDLQKALDYLEYYRKKHPLSRQYIHDACLFNIPKMGDWDKEQWTAKLIGMKYSPKIMNLLPFAVDIEKFVYAGLPSRSQALKDCGQDAEDNVIRKYYMKALSQLFPLEWPNRRLPNKLRREKLWDYCAKHLKSDVEAFIEWKKAPSKKNDGLNHKPFPELLQFIIRRKNIFNYTKKELRKIALKVVYAEIDKKHIPFAEKCLEHGISREDFNKIIQYVENPKTMDMLPELLVEDEAYPDYRLIKMPSQDPRTFILGKLTGCCQTVGDAGEMPALHGGESPFGGFYVLIKKEPQGEERIIAQSWSGITHTGEIVFDSVEYNLIYPPRLVESFFLKAAQKIVQINPTIKRVIVGGGGQTPAGLKKYTILPSPYSKIIGYPDIGYDSEFTRYILAESRELPYNFKTVTDFVATTGIDTYAKFGEKSVVLVLNALERIRFWKNHTKTYKLLRENDLNPLVEEGYLNGARDRQGEFFLTAEALDKLFKHYLPCDSVFFHENDLANIKGKLRALNCGESASMAVMEGAHCLAVYIKNVDGQFKAFIVDLEEDVFQNVKLIKALESTYPQIKIIATNTELQADYSNSGVFMLQTLRFFAKEGERIFEVIDIPSRLEGSWPHYHLKNAYIPSGLLKTLAGSILKNIDPFSGEALSTVVSAFKQINLSDYLAKNILTIGDRKFSKAAIQKKYRFFDLLEKLL